MKQYIIKVNGVAYAVEVEEAGAAGSVPFAAAAPAAVPAVAPAPAPAPAAPAAPVVAAAPAPAPAARSAAGKTGSELIKAPMPGTILSIQVSVGQAVKKNDVLCILEAMKMENEIVTPRDGVVASVSASKGSSVNAGDLLVSLE